MSATFVRPRARTSASFSLGGDLERRDYRTDPDSLGPLLAEGMTLAIEPMITAAPTVVVKNRGAETITFTLRAVDDARVSTDTEARFLAPAR